MSQKNNALQDLLETFKNFYSKSLDQTESSSDSQIESISESAVETVETPESTIKEGQQETQQPSYSEMLENIDQSLEHLIQSNDSQIVSDLVVIGKKLLKLEQNSQERYSHRFDGKKYSSGKGIDSFANDTAIEETAAFADEVERLCGLGIDRRSAYLQAKNNLTHKE